MLGFRVMRLVRSRIMHIELGDLAVGNWRQLAQSERDALLTAVGMAEDDRSPNGQSRTA